MINDEPTTFWFDGKPYEPSNFEHKFYGTVSMRDALAHSLNVATVKLAEQTGYAAVVDLARRAGLNLDIQPTPAVALGAYEVTPLEIAGGYTIYANHGILFQAILHLQHHQRPWIEHVRQASRSIAPCSIRAWRS